MAFLAGLDLTVPLGELDLQLADGCRAEGHLVIGMVVIFRFFT